MQSASTSIDKDTYTVLSIHFSDETVLRLSSRLVNINNTDKTKSIANVSVKKFNAVCKGLRIKIDNSPPGNY